MNNFSLHIFCCCWLTGGRIIASISSGTENEAGGGGVVCLGGGRNRPTARMRGAACPSRHPSLPAAAEPTAKKPRTTRKF